MKTITHENQEVIEALKRDFLHTYLALSFCGTREGKILMSSDGVEVKVVQVATHKFGPGRCSIIAGGGLFKSFNTMRGCVVRREQGSFINALQFVLE
jgi:hypothetical protein